MGRSSSKASMSEDAEVRVGRWSVSSRYHKLPARIEDDYLISGKVLGSGYNGVVRMAYNRNSTHRQQFAVKAFKLSNIVGEKRAQLDSEVSVFLGMDHPHVARLFDVYETPEHLYLVMECLEGGELFDRVMQRKRFSEQDAAEATRQMLLAVNYLHSHGIVHRDLKLENFLFDFKNGDHLKLIDFGFSKVWDPNMKMHVSCGTLSYVAPEVLDKNYTSQCDLWSLGVIAFILLSGYMPFAGSEHQQKSHILAGKYTLKQERWSAVSEDALNFVQSLLQVRPEKRLTAETALEHPWIAQRRSESCVELDEGILEGLRRFTQASKFRRCCMELMAWSLSNEERAKVREYFVSMDTSKQGTITLLELKQVMTDKFHISDEETKAIFEAMDSNHDDTIHYSDFLAAMLNTRIAMHDDLLRSAFKRFDCDCSGYITVDDLRRVLGDDFEGEQVEMLLNEADLLKNGHVSYAEFVAYLRCEPLDLHEAAEVIIENELMRARAEDPKDSRHRKDLKFWSHMPMALARRRGSKTTCSVSPTSAPGSFASPSSPADEPPPLPPSVDEAASDASGGQRQRRSTSGTSLRSRRGGGGGRGVHQCCCIQ